MSDLEIITPADEEYVYLLYNINLRESDNKNYNTEYRKNCLTYSTESLQQIIIFESKMIMKRYCL
jgi:hypothetical protein